MTEATIKAVSLALQRLGYDPKQIAEEDLQISERDIAEKVVAREEFVKPLIDAKIKEHDGVLVNKINSRAQSKLGLPKELIEQANGDFDTLFTLASDHISKQSKTPNDEKENRLKELQEKLRQAELAQEEYATKFNEEKEQIVSKLTAQQEAMKRGFAVKSALMKVGLTDDIAKNLDFYSQPLQSTLEQSYDLKEQDGKLVAFKKGSDEKVYKEGSAEQADLSYLVDRQAETLKWKKQAAADGKGDPEKRGSGAGKQQPQMHSRYGGALAK